MVVIVMQGQRALVFVGEVGHFGGAMARKCCDGTFVAGALWKSVAGIFFAWGLKGAILDRSKDFTWVLKKVWNSDPCNPEFRPLQSRKPSF